MSLLMQALFEIIISFISIHFAVHAIIIKNKISTR